MDIHRCRFVDYSPSPINALAFSYASGSSQRTQPLRLAIGRANGDIEIWNPGQGRWIHEITCKGGRNRSIEGLAWIQDPNEVDEGGRITYGRLRLFSIGYSSYVTEWDLTCGVPLQHSVGTHPEIWCLAAQPSPFTQKKRSTEQSRNQDGVEDEEQRLVAGCADGSIVLFSTRDMSLHMEKVVARNATKNGRALSITFQSRHVVVVGFADGFVRVYDIRNGNQIRAMSLGGGSNATRKSTLVWTVSCLKDGTILAGDSTGSITFWDGKNFAQLQKIQSHEADVLCMTTSGDSKMVFTGGMDRRLVAYTRDSSSQRQRWANSSFTRAHQHDIKAIAGFENSKMSILVSGGLDIAPIVTPMRQFGKEYRRRLPHIPQQSPVTSAQRLVASWWDNTISIWKIHNRKSAVIEGTFVDEEPSYRHMAQLNLKDEEHISTASLSTSGQFLAVATSRTVKIFRLIPNRTDSSYRLKVKKLEVPLSVANSGAHLLQFSPDGKWLLIITRNNKVKIARTNRDVPHGGVSAFVSTAANLFRPQRSTLVQTSLDGPWGIYTSRINRTAFSSDSSIIAISDLAGRIDSWILCGEEDITEPEPEVSGSDADSDTSSDSDNEQSTSYKKETNVSLYGQSWAQNSVSTMLPRLSHSALVFAFRPSPPSSNPKPNILNGTNGLNGVNGHGKVKAVDHASTEDRLLVVTSAHEILEFNILQGRYTDWSRQNYSFALPESFKLQRDRAMGCVWDVDANHRQRIWIYGSQWLCMFDLSQNLAQDEASIQGDPQKEEQGKVLIRLGEINATENRRANILKERETQRHTTGAGSKIPDRKLETGFGARKIRKLDSRGNTEIIPIPENSGESPSRETSDSEGEDPLSTSDNDEQRMETEQNIVTAIDEEKEAEKRRRFYLTTRYRPILSIVPLPKESETEMEAGDDRSQSLEVALIERPFHDLTLPPRFVGAHDRDNS